MSMVSKEILVLDESDVFSASEESTTKLAERKKKRNPPVKRAAEKVSTCPAKKRRAQPDVASEALKTLLCQWSEDEDCMRKILGGRKMAFFPIFI